MNFHNKLTEKDINDIDVKSQLEGQIQIQETNDSGRMFDKISSMKLKIYKSSELNGSDYVKIPSRSNSILINKNDDKYCFTWSILSSPHPFNNDNRNRVSNYRQNFNEIIIDGFDFTNGFKCSGVQKLIK